MLSPSWSVMRCKQINTWYYAVQEIGRWIAGWGKLLFYVRTSPPLDGDKEWRVSWINLTNISDDLVLTLRLCEIYLKKEFRWCMSVHENRAYIQNIKYFCLFR